MSDGQQQALVDRPDVPVMFVATGDDQPSITRAGAELEETIGSLSRRRFYGVFDPIRREYRACVERRRDDDPGALGLDLPAQSDGCRAVLVNAAIELAHCLRRSHGSTSIHTGVTPPAAAVTAKVLQGRTEPQRAQEIDCAAVQLRDGSVAEATRPSKHVRA